MIFAAESKLPLQDSVRVARYPPLDVALRTGVKYSCLGKRIN